MIDEEIMEQAVRAEIAHLRGADEEVLDKLNDDSTIRRLCWFNDIKDDIDTGDGPVLTAYRLLLRRFGVAEPEMPIIQLSERKVVFHSMNFCPTLEACRILGLDTRHVCRLINERSTDALVKQVDPNLKFSRNYEALRPYAPYCEEMITLM